MTKICPLCGKKAEPFEGNIIEDNEVIWDFTYCKVCGRFELSEANDDPKQRCTRGTNKIKKKR